MRGKEPIPSGLERMNAWAERVEEVLAGGPATTDELAEITGIPRPALQGILRALEAEGLIYEDTAVQEGLWVPVRGGLLDQRPPPPPPASAERMARCGVWNRMGLVGTTGMTLPYRILLQVSEMGGRTPHIAEALGEDVATVERLLRELQADGLVEEGHPGTQPVRWCLHTLVQAERAAGGIHVWFGPPRPLEAEWVRKQERDRRRRR